MPYDNSPYKRFEDDPYPNEKSGAPKILIIILIAVVAFFVIGTVLAFATKKGTIGKSYRQSDPTPEKVINRSRKSSSKVTTSNIGQLRISTKPEKENSTGTLLIVSPWFSYSENDVQLFEELSLKDRQIKSIINGYFTAHTKSELLSLGEKKVKEELKEQINSQLVMGGIKAIYFDQYIFFE